ncbi:hypothetical protein GQ457_07G044080 [Hibiscus cannabinus]
MVTNARASLGFQFPQTKTAQRERKKQTFCQTADPYTIWPLPSSNHLRVAFNIVRHGSVLLCSVVKANHQFNNLCPLSFRDPRQGQVSLVLGCVLGWLEESYFKKTNEIRI